MSAEFDMVITSGGIGPTHDDVTIKAVALAFDETIESSPEMLAHLYRAHHHAAASTTGSAKSPLRSSFLRMAQLPTNSLLRFPPPPAPLPTMTATSSSSTPTKLLWPVLQCRNVFILPGVPEFFFDKITTIAEHFIHPKSVAYFRKVLLSID